MIGRQKCEMVGMVVNTRTSVLAHWEGAGATPDMNAQAEEQSGVGLCARVQVPER